MFKKFVKETLSVVFMHPVKLMKALWVWIALYAALSFFQGKYALIPEEGMLLLSAFLKAVLGVALARLILLKTTKLRIPLKLEELNYFFTFVILGLFPLGVFLWGLTLIFNSLPCLMCGRLSFNWQLCVEGGLLSAVLLYIFVRISAAIPSAIYIKESVFQNIKKVWKISGTYRFSLIFSFLFFFVFSLLVSLGIASLFLIPYRNDALTIHLIQKAFLFFDNSFDIVFSMTILSYLAVVYRAFQEVLGKEITTKDALNIEKEEDKEAK